MHRDETILAVPMCEAARRLGLSQRTVANLVSQHQLASLKVGRRRIIPVLELEAFIKGDHWPGRTGRTEALQGSSGSTE